MTPPEDREHHHAPTAEEFMNQPHHDPENTDTEPPANDPANTESAGDSSGNGTVIPFRANTAHAPEQIPAPRSGEAEDGPGEVLDGELLPCEPDSPTDSENPPAGGELIPARRRVVTVPVQRVWLPAQRRVVRVWQHPVTRATGRVAKTATSATATHARRHGAIAHKGMEQARQARRAERQQHDLKAARQAAAAEGDFDKVSSLQKQMNDSHTARVRAFAERAEAVWSVTKRVSIIAAIVLPIVLVTGLINGFGRWLGDWDALDVLTLLGSLIGGVVTTVRYLVTNLAWLAPCAAGLAGLVWLSRRWRDGKQLGEQVLAPNLRRGETVQHVALDEGELIQALGSIGVPGLTQAVKDGWPNRQGDRPWVQMPIVDGPGMSAKLRLPRNAPVEKVDKAKVTLAHNLGCLPAELRVRKDEADPSVLDLYRLDPGELRRAVPDHPLLSGEQHTDFFEAVPVGITPFREPIETPLFERNFVIAGRMGSGKSTLVLDLVAGALLDPVVDVDVFVFAENSDYDPLAPYLATLAKGGDDENVQACHDHIAALHADLDQRGKLLAHYGEPKLTREIAAKDSRMRPRLVVIDECQSFFRQDKPEDRKAVENMVLKFYSAARKYGIVLVFATPTPSNNSLPRDIVSITDNLACFAIGDKARNNIVLGENAYENGISALGLQPATKHDSRDAGTSIAIGYSDDYSTTLRCYMLDKPAMGTLTEKLADVRGEEQPTVVEPATPRDILADVAEVLAGEDVPAKDVAARLRTLAPNYVDYQKLDAKSVQNLLAAEGVRVTFKDGYLMVRTQRVQHALAERAVSEDDD